MKVYAYLRVSGAGQLDGHGFDRQLDTVTKYCKAHKHTVEKTFKEQVSGTKDETDRPEFKAMVTEIMKNGVDTIVVESLDRLAREYRIQEQLLIYLASKDITLVVCNTGENITRAISEDPMKKAMIQMQGIFAELDKALTVKKLRHAREAIRADRGKCEGRKGYWETEEGTEILKEIRRLRISRKGRLPMKYNDIADRLNELGYTARNGMPFNATSVRGIVHRFRNRVRVRS